MYQIVKRHKTCFLRRPRRFGKSLLVSSLESYFEGRRDLFEGLAISRLEKDWTSYPVLHLDLSISKYKAEDDLPKIINMILAEWEGRYGSISSEETFGARFSGIIKRVCQKEGRPVVLLIDEYDAPLSNNVENSDLLEKNRIILGELYSAIKASDRSLKFTFPTGVTMFGKLSLFSDLNSTTDLSMV